MEGSENPIKRKVLKRQNIKTKILFFILKKISIMGIIILITFSLHNLIMQASDVVAKKANEVYVDFVSSLPPSLLVDKAKKEYALEDAIKIVSKEQKIPESALAAIVEQESSNNKFPTSGVENLTFSRVSKKYPHLPEAERIELARSHGAAHVMGITALEFCGIKYSELYDHYKGLSCAAKYFKMLLDKNKNMPIEDRLWESFKNYNGTGDQANKHADKVYSLMKKKILKSMEKETT